MNLENWCCVIFKNKALNVWLGNCLSWCIHSSRWQQLLKASRKPCSLKTGQTLTFALPCKALSHSMFPTSGEMCHMCYSCKIPNIFSVVLLCFMLQHLSIWKAQVSMTCGWARVLKIMDHVMLYKISPSLLSLFSRSYTIWECKGAEEGWKEKGQKNRIRYDFDSGIRLYFHFVVVGEKNQYLKP